MASKVRLLLVIVLISTTVLISSVVGMKSSSESNNNSESDKKSDRSGHTEDRGSESTGSSRSNRHSGSTESEPDQESTNDESGSSGDSQGSRSTSTNSDGYYDDDDDDSKSNRHSGSRESNPDEESTNDESGSSKERQDSRSTSTNSNDYYDDDDDDDDSKSNRHSGIRESSPDEESTNDESGSREDSQGSRSTSTNSDGYYDDDDDDSKSNRHSGIRESNPDEESTGNESGSSKESQDSRSTSTNSNDYYDDDDDDDSKSNRHSDRRESNPDEESTGNKSGSSEERQDSKSTSNNSDDDHDGTSRSKSDSRLNESDEKSRKSDDRTHYVSTTQLTTKTTTGPTTKFQGNKYSTSTEPKGPIKSCPGGNLTLNGVSVSFNTSKAGESVNSTQRCPPESSYANFPLATRRCNLGWEDPEFNSCFNQEDLIEELDRIMTMNITNDNVSDVVLVLLLAANQDDITKDEVDMIQQILSRVVQVNSESPLVTDSVVGVIDSVMEVDDDILSQIPDAAGFVETLENQMTNFQRSPGNYSETQENVAVTAVKVDQSSFEEPYQFDNPLMTKRNENQYRSSSITLPPGILDIIRKTFPDINDIPITFLAFRDSNLFVTNGRTRREKRDDLSRNRAITSQVISATVELDDVTITNLPSTSRVVIRFQSEDGDEGEGQPSCVFWDYSSDTQQGKWSTAGCTTQYKGKEIICTCDHLTSFAVLFSETTDADTFHFVLHYITLVGCVISIVCLAICLVVMLLIKSIRVRQQTHIHINLCISLLALYVTFLFGVDKAENPVTCKVISALIHFFCLSSMAWMSVEAYSIYKIIWKVERSNVRHLLLVSFIPAWGIPAVAAILVFFLDNSHSYENEPDYCFLHEGYGFYFGFLTIGAILTLYNSFVFILAIYRVNCRGINATEKSEKRDEVVRRVVGSFLFWILLGLSWTFGFFSTFKNPTSQPFRLLFCIFLSLQGFFMFCLLIVQNAQVKKQIAEFCRDKAGKYNVSKAKLSLFKGNRSITASENTYETNTK